MSKQFGNKGTWEDFYTDHFSDLTKEYSNHLVNLIFSDLEKNK